MFRWYFNIFSLTFCSVMLRNVSEDAAKSFLQDGYVKCSEENV